VSDKRVIPRGQANSDIDQVIAHRPSEAGEKAALGFIDALDRTYRRIARNPATGSIRYAHELDLPGLRSWPLRRYPYLVFYVELDDHIDVWRVLHAERDVPAWMSAPQGT
jgi:toxin ParE1/3/4